MSSPQIKLTDQGLEQMQYAALLSRSWPHRPLSLVLSIVMLLDLSLEARAQDSPNVPRLAMAAKAAIENELATSKTPSLQVAIARDGALLFEGAVGAADLEHNVPATTGTRYRTASISKWFTAAAAFKLSERGDLDLDAPIQSYCPDYSEKAWPVSTRQLLSHTGGIRHYLDFDELTEAAATSADQEALARRRDRERLDDFTRYTDTQSPLDQFSADPLVYEPGTDWLYSSFGYRIIGCVIAGASGVPYREYMRTEVFEPLRMLRTDDDDAWRITPGRAKGYRLQDGVVRRADIRDVSGNLPAGGHLTTATDLVSFAQAFDDGQLVNAASQREMTFRPGGAAFSLDQPSWRDAIPRQGAYGFGLMIFPAATGYWYGHSGRQAGRSAIVIHDPLHDISIAVLSNAKGWNGYMRLVRRLHAIATDEGRHQSTTGKAGSR